MPDPNFKFQLGEEVKDLVTGYVGHVTGRIDHITGCNTYFVQRQYKPKEKIETSEHFDEPRLVATGKKIKFPAVKETQKIKPGYDRKIVPPK